jgi:NAD(P)H dehydrogenase (quinone)
MTFLPNLIHHGIIYVPIGAGVPELSNNKEVIGGSAWGAGTVANGDGSRQVPIKSNCF